MCNKTLAYASQDILSAVMVSEGVMILFANMLTLATFACNSHMIKRTTYCLLSVAAADGLVGFSAILTHTAQITCTFNGPYKIFCQFLWQVFQSASLFGLVLVAVERMYATVWAIRHRNAGRRWYLVGIAFEWVLSTVMGILYVASSKEISRWTKTVLTIAALVVLSIAYVAIFIKVKKQSQQQSCQKTGQERIKREWELARTLSIVTAFSLLTWIPDSIYHFVPGYASFSAIHQSFQVVRLLNSIVNPLIYFLILHNFRRALRSTVKRCFFCKGDQIAPTNDLMNL
ncbi:predicted protein [Nematostella vectensis]|uniref:G-protein coupled receptors family 1 profile domain-containing protein n=1 Tax=Nematostella vectensis TaxID=45351 RepID=A7S7N3_NEMVE|nr:predicted protein [Nematostella vectensis]|eukprot:XP_001632328.1 predicted protein [Nematostella vectensis]